MTGLSRLQWGKDEDFKQVLPIPPSPDLDVTLELIKKSFQSCLFRPLLTEDYLPSFQGNRTTRPSNAPKFQMHPLGAVKGLADLSILSTPRQSNQIDHPMSPKVAKHCMGLPPSALPLASTLQARHAVTILFTLFTLHISNKKVSFVYLVCTKSNLNDMYFIPRLLYYFYYWNNTLFPPKEPRCVLQPAADKLQVNFTCSLEGCQFLASCIYAYMPHPLLMAITFLITSKGRHNMGPVHRCIHLACGEYLL